MSNLTTINSASQRNTHITLSTSDDTVAGAKRDAQDIGWQDDFIPEEHKETVRKSTQHIRHCLEDIAQHIFEVGKELNDVKELLGYGIFGRWLDANFPGSKRLAQHWMRVYRRLGTKANILDKLPPTALYYLAMPSTPEGAIRAVAQRIDPNHSLSLKDVINIIEESKGTLEGCDIGIDNGKCSKASIHDMDKVIERIDKALNKAIRALGDRTAQDCHYVIGYPGVVKFRQIRAAIELLRSQIHSEAPEKAHNQTDDTPPKSPVNADWTVVNEPQILAEISEIAEFISASDPIE